MSYSGIARLWDTRSQAPNNDVLINYDDEVEEVCFAMSVDGKLVVAGCTDRTIRRWDVLIGAQIGGSLGRHQCRVN